MDVEKFQLLAQPAWVNLLVLVPIGVFFLWRKRGLLLSKRQLMLLSLFAGSFGFVEASVVVYLRAAVGLLPGYQGSLSDVQHDVQHASQAYRQDKSLDEFPKSLLTVEPFREAATIIMLLSIALLGASKTAERSASFLWTFAVWDISYYANLWAIVRWPASLKDLDVLFLIPVPWVAQVWFPLLVSGLCMFAIVGVRKEERV